MTHSPYSTDPPISDFGRFPTHKYILQSWFSAKEKNMEITLWLRTGSRPNKAHPHQCDFLLILNPICMLKLLWLNFLALQLVVLCLKTKPNCQLSLKLTQLLTILTFQKLHFPLLFTTIEN